MNGERKSSLKAVQARAGVGQPLAYYPKMARRVGGVKAAVMLGQLLFYSSLECVQQRGGWVYKSVQDMEQATGLTKHEQQSARRALLKLQVIEAQLKGIPRVWYYRVDVDRLAALMLDPAAETLPAGDESSDRGSHPTRFPPGDNPANKGKPSRSMLGGSSAQLNNESENTTEITPESKSAARTAPPPAQRENFVPGSEKENHSEPRNGGTGGGSGTGAFVAMPDPRLSHPAILLVISVTRHWPPAVVYDRLIEALGETPDAARFARVHEEWCARGYRPTNLAGLLDWYRDGIPPAVGERPRGPLSTVNRLEPDTRSEAELEQLRATMRAVWSNAA